MLGWIILLLNAAATLFMLGLIWFVQIVHYPLMGMVPDQISLRYAAEHQWRTTWIVAPAMCVEAISGLLVVFVHPVGMGPGVAALGFLIIVFIFYRTGVVHVPQHRFLASQHEVDTCRDETCRELVRSNWLRTVAWTIRGALVVFMLVECIDI